MALFACLIGIGRDPIGREPLFEMTDDEQETMTQDFSCLPEMEEEEPVLCPKLPIFANIGEGHKSLGSNKKHPVFKMTEEGKEYI